MVDSSEQRQTDRPQYSRERPLTANYRDKCEEYQYRAEADLSRTAYTGTASFRCRIQRYQKQYDLRRFSSAIPVHSAS